MGKNNLKKGLKKIIRNYLIKKLNITNSIPLSYSQDSEDEILEKIFSNISDGFFVDIGAFHPTQYSNTYRFYLKGWTGINIDPRPSIMKEFDKLRPRDINLNIGISKFKGEIDYYIFDQPAVNTFQKEVAFGRNKKNGFKLLNVEKVKVEPLISVFEEYVKDKKIDFLSIDVEGYEIEILKQNDWRRFRPKVIICEMLFNDSAENPNPLECNSGSKFWALVEDLNRFETHRLLVDNEYGVLSKGVGSVIYVDKKAVWN